MSSNRTIHVRVSDEEHAAITAAAEALGLQVSDYVRQAARCQAGMRSVFQRVEATMHEETISAIIVEHGNGFPAVGDYCQDDNGDLYRIVQTSGNIETSGRGDGNWIRGKVEAADWDDVEEGEVHTALVELRAR